MSSFGDGNPKTEIQEEETNSGLSKTAGILIAVGSVLLVLVIGGVVAIIVIKKKGNKEEKVNE